MPASVLVVCTDLHQSDLIMAELVDVGLDGTPAFSADEALGLLVNRSFDAIVISEDLEDGLIGLVRWMGKRHKGLVVTLPERSEEDVDEAIAESAGPSVVGRLVAALGTAQLR